MNRWKFRKVTPEQIAEMKQIREAQGISYAKIGEQFGIDGHSARYWIDDAYRESCRAKARARPVTPMSPESKLRRREYIRNYINRRYNEDPEFRNRFLGHSKKWQRKKREQIEENSTKAK